MKYEKTILIIFFSLFFIDCHSQKVSSKKPNIIYILADDLGYGDTGPYNQTKIETPNINTLAKEGMLFTQHYSGAPVCAPARSVLLTGKHSGHSYIRGNDEMDERGDVWNFKAVIKDSLLEGQRGFPQETVTFAKILQNNGYKTGIVGKWGLGSPNSESIPTKMGFDYFFGYNCQRQAHTYNPIHLYENEKRVYLKNDTITPGTGISKNADPYKFDSYKKYNQQDYSPSISFEKLMGFIEENKSVPFFLYWASPIPHAPLQAPKKWIDYYVNKFGDEEPYFFREGAYGEYFPVRYPHATYAAMVSYLDENIGKLISYLKKENLYDNTLIIFTSDNGPSSAGGGDPVWFDSARPFDSNYGKGKGFLYEGGIRVPMIATWPSKIKANSKTKHISAFWDILPTFCEIVNTEIPKDSDGISFYNTLISKGKQKKHEYLYWEFPEYNGQVAVRWGQWKLVWKNINKGNKEIELYNLRKDLSEKYNIALNHPQIIDKIFKIIKKEHTPSEIKKFQIETIEKIYIH